MPYRQSIMAHQGPRAPFAEEIQDGRLRLAMEALSAVAKSVHPAYGRSVRPAWRSARTVRAISAALDALSARISARARRGERTRKNTADQAAFKVRLTARAR